MADTWRKPHCPDENDWHCLHPEDYRELENAWLERRSAADRFWQAADAAPFPIETIADVLCMLGIESNPERLRREAAKGRLIITRLGGSPRVSKRDFLAYLAACREVQEPQNVVSPAKDERDGAAANKRALERLLGAK